MRRLSVDPLSPDPAAIREAATVLLGGGLVAFPTETVYGLGANAFDVAAVRRIYEAKDRPAHNPLIVHLANRQRAEALARDWPPMAERLAAAFWPGPLTIVVRKRAEISNEVTAGLDTVGLRVPSHPVALALLREAARPIAAPSANPFTGISPTTGAHVEESLAGRVDLVLDAGPTPVGIESAVVDVTGDAAVLLRPGSIPPSRIAAVVGPLLLGGTVADDQAPRRSPGMGRRHYAPRGEVRLFHEDERTHLPALTLEARGRGRRTGALLLAPADAPVDHPILMPPDPAGYAQALYAALRELERGGCDLIFIERVPDSAEWSGISDRLRRAAVDPD